MRIKLLKEYQGVAKGTILRVSRDKGNLLIAKGKAIITKDMTASDYHALDEEQANGQHTILRTHHT